MLVYRKVRLDYREANASSFDEIARDLKGGT